MTALWASELAARFWEDAGGAPPGYPRDLLEPACLALPIAPFALADLSIARVNAWLAEHGRPEARLREPDRRLRACILILGGHGLLFVDAADDEDEQRFSVAHELAHYLVEYAAPRATARTRLGDAIVPVLDGRRRPTADERLGAVLAGVPLAGSAHLMERTPDGHLPGQTVSDAERRADELAFELLAPREAVCATLPTGAPRGTVVAALRQTFGLPPGPAALYASWLAPAPSPGALLVRQLFGAG